MAETLADYEHLAAAVLPASRTGLCCRRQRFGDARCAATGRPSTRSRVTPRVLAGVVEPDTSCTLLGTTSPRCRSRWRRWPINASLHPEGELLLARERPRRRNPLCHQHFEQFPAGEDRGRRTVLVPAVLAAGPRRWSSSLVDRAARGRLQCVDGDGRRPGDGSPVARRTELLRAAVGRGGGQHCRHGDRGTFRRTGAVGGGCAYGLRLRAGGVLADLEWLRQATETSPGGEGDSRSAGRSAGRGCGCGRRGGVEPRRPAARRCSGLDRCPRPRCRCGWQRLHGAAGQWRAERHSTC